jgi:hypothetical protein
MKTSEVLERALEKLGPNGEHWTQGSYHRDKNGKQCGPRDAEKHCAVGALWMIVHDAGLVANAIPYLTRAFTSEPTQLNDHEWTDFPVIRAGFLKAIELARKQEQANDN